MKDNREANDQWLRAQCNRYANGKCSLRKCLVRGGYEGAPVDYELATCEPHEILTEIKQLREYHRLFNQK